MAVFSSTGRVRNEAAVQLPRFGISRPMSRVPLRAALHPDDHQPAVGGEQLDMISRYLAPMLSKITSTP